MKARGEPCRAAKRAARQVHAAATIERHLGCGTLKHILPPPTARSYLM